MNNKTTKSANSLFKGKNSRHMIYRTNGDAYPKCFHFFELQVGELIF